MRKSVISALLLMVLVAACQKDPAQTEPPPAPPTPVSKLYSIQRDPDTKKIVAFTRTQYWLSSQKEVAKLEALTSIGNGQALALFSHAGSGWGGDRPLYAVVKAEEPVFRTSCASELEISGLYPTWTGEIKKRNGGQYTSMLWGEGGDGGEHWWSVLFVTITSLCDVAVIYQDSSDAPCPSHDSPPISCSGVVKSARLVDAVTGELDVSSVKGEFAQTIDLRPLLDKKILPR